MMSPGRPSVRSGLPSQRCSRSPRWRAQRKPRAAPSRRFTRRRRVRGRVPAKPTRHRAPKHSRRGAWGARALIATTVALLWPLRTPPARLSTGAMLGSAPGRGSAWRWWAAAVRSRSGVEAEPDALTGRASVTRERATVRSRVRGEVLGVDRRARADVPVPGCRAGVGRRRAEPARRAGGRRPTQDHSNVGRPRTQLRQSTSPHPSRSAGRGGAVMRTRPPERNRARHRSL